MIVNYILVVAIIVLIILAIKNFITHLDDEDEMDTVEEHDENDIDINFFVKETKEAFARSLKANLNDDTLSEQELIRKRKRTANLRENLSGASYGDSAAKDYIKTNIYDLLYEPKYAIEDNIDKIIPFDKPESLSSNQRFEIILYAYNEKRLRNDIDKDKDGFELLMEEWELCKEQKLHKDGSKYYIVTAEEIYQIYVSLFETDEKKRKSLPTSKKLGVVHLTMRDKINILTQFIFEKDIGLGPVDMLFETTVDEIDAGVSGIPKGSFNMRKRYENLTFSYESIWVTFHGRNVHMECLSFESQQELVRVCNNIYKYNPPGVLSRVRGYIVSTMIDGSRIVVVRPPFADSYAFFLRKFDSTPSIEPEKLDKEGNKIIPFIMMKWLIRGQRNIAITGDQGTGKSTRLKSFVKFIPTEFNIRLQELQAELNLRFAYPMRNIVAFQETDSISAQEGLNLQKKTNGTVNLIGEAANALQISYVIQTSMVASLFDMFTHHAKTASGLVEASSNNLLEIGLYKDKKDAVAMCAQVLNIDYHVTNKKGKRYMERITEIIPQNTVPYPSKAYDEAFLKRYKAAVKKAKEMEKEDFETAALLGLTPKEFYQWKAEAEMLEKMDAMEYYRRSTDPELYTTKDLVKWHPLLNAEGKAVYDSDGHIKGYFRLESLPSENMMNEIRSKLTLEEEEEFEADMARIQRVSDGEESAELDAWMRMVLKMEKDEEIERGPRKEQEGVCA